MADKSVNLANATADEAFGEIGPESKAGLLAKIENLKRIIAESRVGQTCRQYGQQVDESVHAKPYHYIAGAAAVGALVGLVAGLMIARKRD